MCCIDSPRRLHTCVDSYQKVQYTSGCTFAYVWSFGTGILHVSWTCKQYCMLHSIREVLSLRVHTNAHLTRRVRYFNAINSPINQILESKPGLVNMCRPLLFLGKIRAHERLISVDTNQEIVECQGLAHTILVGASHTGGGYWRTKKLPLKLLIICPLSKLRVDIWFVLVREHFDMKFATSVERHIEWVWSSSESSCPKLGFHSNQVAWGFLQIIPARESNTIWQFELCLAEMQICIPHVVAINCKHDLSTMFLYQFNLWI